MVVSRAVAPDITSTTITVPTSPRMGVMLMEPICVSRWAVRMYRYTDPHT